jgi:hypothetical protein
VFLYRKNYSFIGVNNLIENFKQKVKDNLTLFKAMRKGQIGSGVVVGLLVVIVLIAIAQTITSNVLNLTNQNTGLWTLFSNILWPMLAILVLFAIVLSLFARG